MPSHSHSQNITADGGSDPNRRDYDGDGGARTLPQGVNTGSVGGGQAHNNLQPYVSVYIWYRVS